MFTSGTTAKFPNPTESASADRLTGPWTEHGESCIGDVKRTTFDSQVACVIKIPGKDLYIAAADRWLLDIDPSWPKFMDVFGSWYDKTKTPVLPPLKIRLLQITCGCPSASTRTAFRDSSGMTNGAGKISFDMLQYKGRKPHGFLPFCFSILICWVFFYVHFLPTSA